MATRGVYILGGSLAAIGRNHGTHKSVDTPSFSMIDVAMERSRLGNLITPGYM